MSRLTEKIQQTFVAGSLQSICLSLLPLFEGLVFLVFILLVFLRRLIQMDQYASLR
jgi:hypothetical protein